MKRWGELGSDMIGACVAVKQTTILIMLVLFVVGCQNAIRLL